MNNNKVKVIGYAKREFYNNGIEYRNFSDDLVGNQQTGGDDNGNGNLTLNNFITTTNYEGKVSRLYDVKPFSNYVTLETLKLKSSENKKLLNNLDVKLNLDKGKLSNFAYFGSTTEFVRVSLENIITLWPASLYVTPNTIINNEEVTGYSVLEYYHTESTNVSRFKINVNFINNKFGISFKENGTILNTFNEGNELRNLTQNYLSYVIYFNGNEYPIIEYTPPINEHNDYLWVSVIGNPFNLNNGSNGLVEYHIKPKNELVEEFFNGLSKFEDNLLNRLVKPKYTSEYEYKVETELGKLITRYKKLTWPVSDGYNIDFNTNQYLLFVKDLLAITKNMDATSSDLISRFLVSDSVSDFDSIPSCNGEDIGNDGQKMNKTLRIYGREFDEIKQYIDGISFANVVTYDKKDNIPDQLIKNLARVLGWETVSSVLDNDLISSYLTMSESRYGGESRGLSPQEADVELWRRLILNSSWIWKSKGTRKAVEFFFKFIGAPDGLINFNEYVYVVKEPLDIQLFKLILIENGLSTNLNDYNIDSDGYPKLPKNNSEMYFQKGGQWYRETGGENANAHISYGNNPHVGPYDNGLEYINQLSNIIPNFEPFTITSTTISNNSVNLFTNYNGGEFDDYTGDFYIDAIDMDGVNITNETISNVEVIPDPCPIHNKTNCGCDIEVDDIAIKIDITNRQECSIIEETPCENLFNDIIYDSELDQFIFDYVVYEQGGSPSLKNRKISEYGPRKCCESLMSENNDNGVPYYHEVYELNEDYLEGTTLFYPEPESSGYICCTSKGIELDLGRDGCGCTLSCQWELISDNFFDMIVLDDYPNVRFLTFKDPSGENRVVNKADSCFCHPLTTPIVITDPYNGDVGYACSMPSDPKVSGGNEAYNKFVSIYATYRERVLGNIDCREIYVNNSIGCEGFTIVSNDLNNGLILFETQNGVQTYEIPQECCRELGFTPMIIESENNTVGCSWRKR